MKKYRMMFLMLIMCVAMLAACRGGGGGGDDGNSSSGSNPQDSIFHHFELVKTDTGAQLKTPLATDGDCVIHLAKDGGGVATLAKTEVDKVIVEGLIIGYTASGGGKTVSVTDVSRITVDGAAASDAILVTVVAKNGDKYFVNPDWVTFDGSAPMTVRYGLMYYGAAADDPNCISTPTATSVDSTEIVSKTTISISTVTGVVEITSVVEDGKIINLVDSNPTETVLDADGYVINGYRIAWNDNGSWYPAGGVVVTLQLPMTTISSAAQKTGLGAGMPYLVRPDGTSVPYNTNRCTVFVDGVDVTATAIVNDLVNY
jgi:hypothetical protein